LTQIICRYLNVVLNRHTDYIAVDVSSIPDWANDWQLSVSVDKCSVLTIGRGTKRGPDKLRATKILTNCKM